MEEYEEYLRTNIAEMAAWTSKTDMNGISVSDEDYKNGSPQTGDMIARNPDNYDDKWLVAKAYFETNFVKKDK